MFFLYIQYYMHFYEIWCFLKSRYIWNRQQCGDNSSIYVKRYLFWFYGMSSWVIYTGWNGDQDGESPDSGIWMVCYQVWWYEICCCMLVVGTGVVLRRDGQVGDMVLGTVVRRGEGWWMLSVYLNHEEQMEILLLIMIWSLIQVGWVRRFLLLDSGVEMVCRK